MIELGKSSVFTVVKEYVLMTVGMFCYAFGWIGCILPAKCMGGGASGLSLLIYYATDGAITIGVMVFIINAELHKVWTMGNESHSGLYHSGNVP